MQQINITNNDKFLVSKNSKDSSQHPENSLLTDQICGSFIPYDPLLEIGSHVVSGKISNVWHSNARRDRLQHLSQYPVCICGSGQELNFIHDNLDELEEMSVVKTSGEKKKKKKQKAEDKTLVKIPEKLVPKELKLVTNFGVKPIKFLDELYSTSALGHKNHKVAFPLLLPNSNKLSKATLDNLKLIINYIGFDEDGSCDKKKFPTSLHRLLEITKKEQDLYNTIFNVVIKEVTVDCIERGELLANIRNRYRNILIQVPMKVKSYHDEIVAQRLLERRLTEEWYRFRLMVDQLSSELDKVKQHENLIKELHQQSKDQLEDAVESTRNNANVLHEFRGLYETERNRLERYVGLGRKECDSWKNASYFVQSEVMNYHNMNDGIELNKHETQWYQMGINLVDQLSAGDADGLTKVCQKTSYWKNNVLEFQNNLVKRDEGLKLVLEREMSKIVNLKEDLEDEYFNAQGQLLKPVDKMETLKVYNVFMSLETALTEINEMFGGHKMLQEEDKLILMKKHCREFSDLAVEVFNRHRNGENNSFYVEHDYLLYLNQLIEKLMNQLSDQLTGDNGVAEGIAAVQNFVENWIARLSNCVGGRNLDSTGAPFVFRALPSTEWTRLKSLLEDWVNLLQESCGNIGRVSSPVIGQDNKIFNLSEVDNWSHRSLAGIESEDTRIRESVINLDESMIRWTSQILLRLAPVYKSNSPEAERTALISSMSSTELEERCCLICDQLHDTTELIIKCSKDIVQRNAMMKLEQQSQLAPSENESNTLAKFQVSSETWIKMSKEMLKQMKDHEKSIIDAKVRRNMENDATPEVQKSDGNKETNEEDNDISELIGNMLEFTMDTSMNNLIHSDPDELEESEESDDEEDLKIFQIPPSNDKVEGVSRDSNVHSKYLLQNPDMAYMGNKFNNMLVGETQIDLPKTDEAFKLIRICNVLQEKLKLSNMEAVAAEEESSKSDLDLVKSKETLAYLEERFHKISEDLIAMKTEKDEELERPKLLSSTNTLDRIGSSKTSKSGGGGSSVSNKRRAPKASKKNKK